MIEENIDLEGVDEICGEIENLPEEMDFLLAITGSSISAPLK